MASLTTGAQSTAVSKYSGRQAGALYATLLWRSYLRFQGEALLVASFRGIQWEWPAGSWAIRRASSRFDALCVAESALQRLYCLLFEMAGVELVLPIQWC